MTIYSAAQARWVCTKSLVDVSQMMFDVSLAIPSEAFMITYREQKPFRWKLPLSVFLASHFRLTEAWKESYIKDEGPTVAHTYAHTQRISQYLYRIILQWTSRMIRKQLNICKNINFGQFLRSLSTFAHKFSLPLCIQLLLFFSMIHVDISLDSH